MRKLLLLMLVVLQCAVAQTDDATTIARCNEVMALGTCSVKLDRTSYPPGTTHIAVSRRMVQLDAMLMLQASDNSMCEIARRACAAGPAATALQQDICHIARSRWRVQ